MPNYLTLYDDKLLKAHDLEEHGGERVFEIRSASGGVVEGFQGGKSKKERKPILLFVGLEGKEFPVNKTNGKTLAGMFGKNTDKWVGESVTLFATTTNFGGEVVPCIRIRPQRPEGAARSGGGDRKQQRNGAGRGGAASTEAADEILARYKTAATDAEMAELKEFRGKHWESWGKGIRDAVGDAAKAARARIDAAGSGAPDADAADPGGGISAEEAAEIARQEAAARHG